MIRPGLKLLALGMALATVLVAPAQATADEDNLARALERYDDLRYGEALAAAEAAVSDPGRGVAELVFAYEIIGLSAAALEREEKAYDAFVVLLAIDPEHELPEGLSPRFTSPFLEAKGFWAERPRFGTEIEVFDKGKLRLKLHDPLGLVDKVRVRFRAPDAPRFNTVTAEPAPRLAVPLPGVGKEVDLVVQLTGEHNGLLHELGEREKPLRVIAGAAGGGKGTVLDGGKGDGRPKRKPIPVATIRKLAIGGSIGVAVVTGIVVGTILIYNASPLTLPTAVAFGDP